MANGFRRPWACVALGVLLLLLPLHAQGGPEYREFKLGSSLGLVLSQVHLTASDVVRIHARPALIQDVRWTTSFFIGDTIEPQKDPVEHIVFSFVDDQLFRLAIDYERTRTEGMTDADMIAALSGRYGPSTPAPRPAKPSIFDRAGIETSKRVAQWSDGDVMVVLSRSAFTGAFQLVVTSAQLDALAVKATAEAVRLERREAPERDAAQRKQDADDARLAKEKARLANKAAFKP
jgi:hypothetical protein